MSNAIEGHNGVQKHYTSSTRGQDISLCLGRVESWLKVKSLHRTHPLNLADVLVYVAAVCSPESCMSSTTPSFYWHISEHTLALSLWEQLTSFTTHVLHASAVYAMATLSACLSVTRCIEKAKHGRCSQNFVWGALFSSKCWRPFFALKRRSKTTKQTTPTSESPPPSKKGPKIDSCSVWGNALTNFPRKLRLKNFLRTHCTSWLRLWLFSSRNSHIILVFSHETSWRNSDRVSLSWCDKYTWNVNSLQSNTWTCLGTQHMDNGTQLLWSFIHH